MNKNKKTSLHREHSGHKQKKSAMTLMSETKEVLWNNKAMRKNVNIFFCCCGQGDLPPLKEDKSRRWGKGEHHDMKLQAAKTGESAHASHAWSRPALRENGGGKKEGKSKNGRNGRQAENSKERL